MKNKLKILTFSIFFLCVNCVTVDGGTLFTTSATILLVNETDVVVKSDDLLGYVIQPGDTLVHKESHTNEYSKRPSINNYDPFAVVDGSNVFIYGDNLSCEIGLTDINNYENRKEVKPLEFEFTFRFTEEKKASGVPCN